MLIAVVVVVIRLVSNRALFHRLTTYMEKDLDTKVKVRSFELSHKEGRELNIAHSSIQKFYKDVAERGEDVVFRVFPSKVRGVSGARSVTSM